MEFRRVLCRSGCFGGCSFCSITEHEGRIIQSRSEGSFLKEIETVRDKVEGFTGIISDIGGPTANMYRMACKDKRTEELCRRPSCVYPAICRSEEQTSELQSLMRISYDDLYMKKKTALPRFTTLNSTHQQEQ